MNYDEIIFVSFVVLRLLSSTKIGKMVKIDFLYSLIIKLLNYIPFISDILEYIKKKAEEYKIEKIKKLIDEVLPSLYIVAENTIQGEKKGVEKKKYVVSELVKRYLPKDIPDPDVISDYISKSIEILNFKQKTEGKVEKIVERTIPILPFLFNIITKILKI